MFIENELSKLKFYDMFCGSSGQLGPNIPLFKTKIVRPFSIPPNVDGSSALADIAPTHSSVFSLQKNGSQFATVTFDPLASVGVFNGVETLFDVDDVFAVVSPPTTDDTLAGVWFTIMGKL